MQLLLPPYANTASTPCHTDCPSSPPQAVPAAVGQPAGGQACANCTPPPQPDSANLNPDSLLSCCPCALVAGRAWLKWASRRAGMPMWTALSSHPLPSATCSSKPRRRQLRRRRCCGAATCRGVRVGDAREAARHVGCCLYGDWERQKQALRRRCRAATCRGARVGGAGDAARHVGCCLYGTGRGRSRRYGGAVGQRPAVEPGSAVRGMLHDMWVAVCMGLERRQAWRGNACICELSRSILMPLLVRKQARSW